MAQKCNKWVTGKGIHGFSHDTSRKQELLLGRAKTNKNPTSYNGYVLQMFPVVVHVTILETRKLVWPI